MAVIAGPVGDRQRVLVVARKAGHVHVFQQVAAVLVVLAVRDVHADLVQIGGGGAARPGLYGCQLGCSTDFEAAIIESKNDTGQTYPCADDQCADDREQTYPKRAHAHLIDRIAQTGGR